MADPVYVQLKPLRGLAGCTLAVTGPASQTVTLWDVRPTGMDPSAATDEVTLEVSGPRSTNPSLFALLAPYRGKAVVFTPYGWGTAFRGYFRDVRPLGYDPTTDVDYIQVALGGLAETST